MTCVHFLAFVAPTRFSRTIAIKMQAGVCETSTYHRLGLHVKGTNNAIINKFEWNPFFTQWYFNDLFVYISHDVHRRRPLFPTTGTNVTEKMLFIDFLIKLFSFLNFKKALCRKWVACLYLTLVYRLQTGCDVCKRNMYRKRKNLFLIDGNSRSNGNSG